MDIFGSMLHRQNPQLCQLLRELKMVFSKGNFWKPITCSGGEKNKGPSQNPDGQPASYIQFPPKDDTQKRCCQKSCLRASLVAQWLRICLPMQGTRVQVLVWEDPTCRGATKPVRHYYGAHAPRARAPQQEKPPRWEARTPQQRVAPTCRN